MSHKDISKIDEDQKNLVPWLQIEIEINEN